MDRLPLPPLALLALSLTSCQEEPDPIIGTWDATLVDDLMFPVMLEGSRYTLDLEIRDDLAGTYTFHEIYAEYTEETRYALSVNADAAPDYTISIPEAELTLTCKLSGAELSCTDQETVAYRFKKR